MHDVLVVLRENLREAFDGAPGTSSWCMGNGPGAGILGTLRSLSAEEASEIPPGGGSTIAAHAEHLRWSMVRARAYFKNEATKGNWVDSWRVSQVSEREWNRMRLDLEAEYRGLLDNLAAYEGLVTIDFTRGALGIVTHSVYHLGAIRQLAGAIRRVPRSS